MHLRERPSVHPSIDSAGGGLAPAPLLTDAGRSMLPVLRMRPAQTAPGGDLTPGALAIRACAAAAPRAQNENERRAAAHTRACPSPRNRETNAVQRRVRAPDK